MRTSGPEPQPVQLAGKSSSGGRVGDPDDVLLRRLDLVGSHHRQLSNDAAGEPFVDDARTSFPAAMHAPSASRPTPPAPTMTIGSSCRNDRAPW